MTDIRVPKLNNNDELYTLIEWCVKDGQLIGPEEPVATLETSKAAEELVCAEGGVLWHVLPAGSQCAPGAVIGRVVPPGTPRSTEMREQSEQPGADGPVITEPARALIDELAIDLDRVRGLGLKLVRVADIERLTATSVPAARTHTLPPCQRAVARTVVRSRQTIPAAYTVVKVDVTAADDEARRWGIGLRKPVGVPELLVAAVAPLHTRFPIFFASPVDDHTVRLAEDAHIGLTIDVGKGLFVPVVRNASSRSLEEIVQIVDGLRLTAFQGGFHEHDLSGGNISIALNHDPDVFLAVPLILPGQTCSVALAGAREEVVVDADHAVTTRTVTNLGLSYDHRFINGRDAALFLKSIKEALESPEWLTGHRSRTAGDRNGR